MALLTTQVDALIHERKVLLDRLATLGLGGPLFHSPAWPDSSASEVEPIDPDAEEMEKLMNLRRRPSKLADALTPQGLSGLQQGAGWAPASSG